MLNKMLTILVLPAIGAAGLSAQTQAPKTENGAVNFSFASGWSFGFPAVRAAVSIPGVGSAISPERTSLPAYSAGVSVRAWKFLVPFAEISGIDTGKAFAQVSSLRSEVEANTYAFHGGLRVVSSKSKIRPYAEFGGGVLRQDLKGTFYESGRPIPAAGSGSAGSLMYGGGLQVFVGRKWGSTVGFDGFRVTSPIQGPGQNYSRVQFGLFYQTRSSVD